MAVMITSSKSSDKLRTRMRARVIALSESDVSANIVRPMPLLVKTNCLYCCLDMQFALQTKFVSEMHQARLQRAPRPCT
eukprot:831007-Pleurochrysis_carterae.AAC.1